MPKFNWLILVAILVGGFIPLQTSVNTMLGSYMKTPLIATFFNFFVGLILISGIILVFYRNQIPSIQELKQVPWYGFVGGSMGVLFVSTIVILTPKIGVTNMLAGALAGQLILSVFFDHFGWFGMPQHPISVQRVLGIAFLILGVIFSQK